MLRRLMAVTLLPLAPFVGACMTMGPVGSPAQFVAAKSPSLVWVTKTDNSVLPLQTPKIIGDTLTGFLEGDYVEMPLASVKAMRARQAAPGRTALLVGGAAAGLGIVLVAFAGGNSGSAGANACTDKQGNTYPC